MLLVLLQSGCSITSNGVSLNMITLSAVSELEVDNITSSSASLDWDAASPTNVYNISYSSDGGYTWVDITSHTGSYINLSGLEILLLMMLRLLQLHMIVSRKYLVARLLQQLIVQLLRIFH